MTNNPTYWNKDSCLAFLRSFAPFEHKYLKVFDTKLSTLGNVTKLQHFNQLLDSQLHGRSSHSLSTEEGTQAANGIRQVYNDDSRYNNAYLEMIDLVRDKFIYEYTGIPGICDFFSPRYFEFEWGMHLELDYEKNRSRYYRDHYMHQVRNLFEMFSLLDDFKYYKKCRDTYSNPDNEIGTFIYDCISRELLTLNYIDGELYGKTLCINGKTASPCVPPPCNPNSPLNCIINTSKHRKEMSEIMLHYVIYSASIIASLVHDIGYPITYLRRIGNTMNNNLPINSLFASFTSDFNEIKTTLHDSLLFSIVKDHSKIDARLREGDHGVYSAILLLMYFRQNGKRLTTLQHCAIELAALVIYNHTNKYRVYQSKKECELQRSDFYKEPLSHLFRMCDDLQEWNRVYFEITDKSNIFICNKCRTPVLRKFGTDNLLPYEKEYSCCCGESKPKMYDTSPFANRRIINVIGCNEVSVSNLLQDNKVESTDKPKPPIPNFKMFFDCGALLSTMPFSATFAKIRADGIREIKRLCSYQGSADSILIDFFASSNPIIVKAKILEIYRNVTGYAGNGCIPPNFGTLITHSTFEKSIDFYEKLLEVGAKLKESGLAIIDSMSGELKKPFNTSNVDVLKEYEDLYNDIVKKLQESELSKRIDLLTTKFPDLTSFITSLKDLDADQFALCKDYFMQQIHLSCYDEVKQSLEKESKVDETSKLNLYRQFYEKLYCSDSSLAAHIESHVSREKYENVKKTQGCASDPFRPDFYVDYGLFIKLWDTVVNRYSHSYFDKKGAQQYFKSGDPNKFEVDDLIIQPCFDDVDNSNIGDVKSCFSHGIYTFKVTTVKSDLRFPGCEESKKIWVYVIKPPESLDGKVSFKAIKDERIFTRSERKNVYNALGELFKHHEINKKDLSSRIFAIM